MTAADTLPLRLPAGREALQHFGTPAPTLDGFQHSVVIAPGEPDPELPSMLGAHIVIVHQAGQSWPSPWSQDQAAWMLRMGGGVILAFADYGDASACFARLLREQNRSHPAARPVQPRAADEAPPIFPLTRAGGTRLHANVVMPGLPGFCFGIVITPEPPLPMVEEPDGEPRYCPDGFVVLTLCAGESWPDPRREELAACILASGKCAILLFTRLSDALAAQERLNRAVTA